MSEVEDFRVERVCPRCQYNIQPGWYHQEQIQPPESNVVVCSLKRVPSGMIMKGPLIDVLSTFLTERTDK